MRGIMEEGKTASAEALQLDFEELKEFAASKGFAIDGFLREYAELQSEYEQEQAAILEREREIEHKQAELAAVREQVLAVKRVVEDNLSMQESLTAAIGQGKAQRKQRVEHTDTSKGMIGEYSSKVAELQSAASLGSGWTPEQEEERLSLAKTREYLSKKLEHGVQMLLALRNDVGNLTQSISEAEAELQQTELAVSQAQEELQTLSLDTASQQKTKEKTDARLHELQKQITDAETELLSGAFSLEESKRQNAALEAEAKTVQESVDATARQCELLLKDANNTQHELERTVAQNSKTEADIQTREQEVEANAQELANVQQQLQRLSKLRAAVVSQTAKAEETRVELEAQKHQLANDITALREGEAKSLRRECESKLRHVSQLQKQKDLVLKKQRSSEKSAKTLGEMIHMHETTKRNLQQEIGDLMATVTNQQEEVRTLLQEKDRHEHEIEMSNQHYYTGLEELKLLALQSKELQARVSEVSLKLKQQQNMYETVRSERNMYSKKLMLMHEDITNLRRMFRTISREIDQHKEDIASRDRAMVKECFQRHNIEKEKEALDNELSKLRKELQSSQQVLDNQHSETGKLSKIIEEAEQERRRQQNEYDAVISERNVLVGQVIKRTAEMERVYERIRLQTSMLRHGEDRYAQTKRELLNLQTDLGELSGKQQTLIGQMASLQSIRRVVSSLERQLLQERSKISAINNELSKPLNVHRWRALESSDPRRFEMLKQIQNMQKLLISKTDQVAEADLLIQEKERSYAELRTLVSRQPGPDIVEQKLAFQQALKRKTKQLKTMDEELEYYRLQVELLKDAILQIGKEMESLNRAWIAKQSMRIEQ